MYDLSNKTSCSEEKSKINQNVAKIAIGSTALPMLIMRPSKIGLCVDLRSSLKLTTPLRHLNFLQLKGSLQTGVYYVE